ncbi:MAG: T9SS type A sorting domain-containing protein [Bacteroidota bacterium]
MQIKLFTIPVGDNGSAVQDMNAFLRGNKISDCPSTAMGENWQVMAFPNPASEMLNVEIEGDFQQGIIGLTDLAGRWLLQREVIEGESNLVLPLDALQNGLYFLQVRSGEGQVKVLRIVVAK